MGSSWEKPWSIAQDVGKRSSSSGMTDVMVLVGMLSAEKLEQLETAILIALKAG